MLADRLQVDVADRQRAVAIRATNERLSAQQWHDALARLTSFYHAATAHVLPIAIWREPGRSGFDAIVHANSLLQRTAIDFAQQASGFVFAPFLDGESRGAYALANHVRMTESGLYVAPALGAPAARQADQLLRQYDAYLSGSATPKLRWYTPFTQYAANHAASEAEFTSLVRSALDFIRSSGVAKVVVSRMMERDLPLDFDPVALFASLCERYPQAFVSLVGIPGVGCWLGATPEVLLQIDEEGLTTMALAGTRRLADPSQLANVQWGEKEIVEQEMVSSYIRDFFHESGAWELRERGPRNVAAGNMAHLQTIFRVDAPEEARLALANRVLHELHPTSAVCGMPKNKALAFIQANEGYDRSFYSGFLGPAQIDGRSSLFVNLRCMQLRKNSAQLYVGAGITADSEPTAEWSETELKAETILAALASPRQPV